MNHKCSIKRVTHTAQKMKFSIKDFSSKCDKIRSNGLGKLHGKLHFLCSGGSRYWKWKTSWKTSFFV